MSYTPGDILERTNKLPLPDDSPYKSHPLNKIRIVGPSPVSTPNTGHWPGASGNLLIVAPVDEFAANEIAPVAALRDEYDVIDYAEPDALKTDAAETPAKKRERLRSPEEVFAEAARDERKAAARGKPKA